MNDLVPVIAVVFGSAIAIVFISGITSIIKTWINRKHSTYDEQEFDRLAKAFLKYRRETEHRLQKLETIISEEKPKSEKEKKQLNKSQLHNSIEFETDQSDSEEQKQAASNNNSTLRNMLKE